ncbi:MAG: hypothetical protein PHG85_02455 [Candidatus Altiarchaeota archaeon]|nr:hypothetical protein [Candidatus Altiarchaeota archaeon]
MILIILLSGCINEEGNTTPKENIFLIEDYDISFSFPKDWEKVTEDNPFDLQCTNSKSYASVFAYRKIDLGEGQTPLTLFESQNEDLFSKRGNVKVISEKKVSEFENKKIHSVLYSAEKEGVKNYYYCNLIEFEDADVFAWLLFTAVPSESERYMGVWDAIAASANYTEYE